MVVVTYGVRKDEIALCGMQRIDIDLTWDVASLSSSAVTRPHEAIVIPSHPIPGSVDGPSPRPLGRHDSSLQEEDNAYSHRQGFWVAAQDGHACTYLSVGVALFFPARAENPGLGARQNHD